MSFLAIEAIGRKLSSVHLPNSPIRRLRTPAPSVDLAHYEVKNRGRVVKVVDVRPTAESRAVVDFLERRNPPGEEPFVNIRRRLRQQQSAETHAKERNLNDIVNETRAETEPEYQDPKPEPTS
jgi:hypothetical protein